MIGAMRTDMVTSYVRDLLERITGERPEPDADGDWPVTLGGALFYVRITFPTDPVVQVFSVAVDEVDPSPDLYARLNEINGQLRFARTFYMRQQILFESEIWGTDVNPTNLDHACRNIATATDSFGCDLVQHFGGTPRFERSKSPTYTPESPVLTGPYL